MKKIILAMLLAGLSLQAQGDTNNQRIGPKEFRALLEGRFSVSPTHVELLGKKLSPQHLDLSQQKMNDAGATSFAPHLSRLSALEDLNLGSNTIGDEGINALAPHLPPSLKCLSLRRNTIGDAGMKALAAHLPRLSALKYLNLKFNDSGAEGARTLIAALPPSLENLSLNGENAIGAEMVIHLADAFQTLTNLKYLNLEFNNIGVERTMVLIASLKHLVQLEGLFLRGDLIDDEGGVALANVLGTMKNLKWLNLNGHHLNDKTKQRLIEAGHTNNIMVSIGGLR